MTYGIASAPAVASVDIDTRARFINRTYGHLFGAIVAFTLFEVALFKTGLAARLFQLMAGSSWLLWLGAFMVVSWLASRVAHNSASMGAQYAALGGFVAAEGIVFAPLLYVAEFSAGGGVIQNAAYLTVLGFAGLTAIAVMTRKDFSFLGGILRWVALCALGLIVAGALFGFSLGIFFTIGMIAFAGAAILYDTSNVLYHYPESRYVGASLQLFASIALLFWYLLQLLMSSRD
ncbi:MAG: Bax inhibitor-1 family protein [Proteobacteria bacterium]|nr:Bax inhibitor-1 family protein [Pseudomonadota bacterium]